MCRDLKGRGRPRADPRSRRWGWTPPSYGASLNPTGDFLTNASDKTNPPLTSPTVAISEKSMKILWALSGGCCAICRTKLVIPAEVEKDDDSIIGEMAHIHPQSLGGPRGGTPFDGNRDHHSNLILLCGNHHKLVDDQENGWPVERMRRVKSEHEAWVARTLAFYAPAAESKASQFHMVQSGADLWSLISSARSLLPSYSEENRTDAEIDQLLSTLDELKDWMDIASSLESLKEQRDARRRMDEILEECVNSGYFLYSRKIRVQSSTGMNHGRMAWWQAEVRAVPVESFFELVHEHLGKQGQGKGGQATDVDGE